MSFTGDGPDSPPAKCAPPLSDITAGIIAAMGILAAYAHRLKTGKGQWVETSLFEAALVQTYWQSAIALATGVAPRAMGSAHPLNAPYQAFEASDGWIVIGGANQSNWLKIVEAIGAPELASDPRFAHNPERMAHLKELEAELGKRFRTKPAAHWLAAARRARRAGGPVNDMLQALSDPQTIAREMVVELEHSTAGPREGDRIPGQVLRYARQGAQSRAPLRRGHERDPGRVRLQRRRDRRHREGGRDRRAPARGGPAEGRLDGSSIPKCPHAEVRPRA